MVLDPEYVDVTVVVEVLSGRISALLQANAAVSTYTAALEAVLLLTRLPGCLRSMYIGSLSTKLPSMDSTELIWVMKVSTVYHCGALGEALVSFAAPLVAQEAMITFINTNVAALKTLAENCSGLGYLNVAFGRELTDAGLVAVATRCVRLRSLHVNGCRRLQQGAAAVPELGGYQFRRVGTATAANAAGPYTFRAGFQPDGIPSLDMNLFRDPLDGQAYLIRDCAHQFVGISRLTPDYVVKSGTFLICVLSVSLTPKVSLPRYCR